MKYFLVLAGLLVALGSASAQTSPPETASGKIGPAMLADQILRSLGSRTPDLWRGWTGNAGSNGSDLACRRK